MPSDTIAELRIAEQTATAIEDVKGLNLDQSLYACQTAVEDFGKQKMTSSNVTVTIPGLRTPKRHGSKTSRNGRLYLMGSFADDGRAQTFIEKMEINYLKKGYKSLSTTNVEKQSEITRHIEKLQDILFD